MLTYEQKKEGGGIAIRLRRGERWWSGTLLRAFAVALAMHACGGLLFTIQPFSLRQEWVPLPPASVETDLSTLDHSPNQHITSQIDAQRRKRRYLLMPQTPTPQLPPISLEEPRPLLSTEILAIADPELFQVEDSLPQNEQTISVPPVTIQLFGGLSDLSHNWVAEEPRPVDPFRAHLRYRVEAQLHTQTGVLFWWRPTEIEGDPALIRKAEEHLTNLRFHPVQRGELMRGEIELVIVEEHG